MTKLSLVAVNPGLGRPASARLAHDIRNIVATVALHLETLERLAGPRGSKAASAAQALIAKAASMCGDAIADANHADGATRRTGFDLVRTIQQVTDLLNPIAPEEFSIKLRADTSVMVLGNPQEVFRILFNLAHNAVMVARRTKRMSRVEFIVERTAAQIAVRVADDGPGLPKHVRKTLSQRFSGRVAANGHGFGLAIARELAERNGGTLELDAVEAGTSFTLVMAGLPIVSVKEGPVTRLLGQRAVRN